MSTINDRIGELIEALGITKTEFAENLKVSQQYISKLVKSGNPSERLIDDICQKFNVRRSWILNDDGDMFEKQDMNFSNICARIGIEDPRAKRLIQDYWELSKEDKELFLNFLTKFGPKKPD